MALTGHTRWSLFLLMAGLLASVALTPAPASPGERAFHFTYAAHIADLPDTAQQVQIWLPLARSRDGQKVLTRVIRSPFPYTVHQEPEYGNDVLHLTLTGPVPAEVGVAVEYEVVVRGQRVDADQPSPAITVEPLERNLAPDALVVIDDQVRSMAQAAIAGRATVLDRARGIYDYVINFMRYDKEQPGWGRGDAQRACALGAGNCTDFHSLFIAMARSVGIPARFKIGAQVPPTDGGEIPGYHCWAECFIEGLGWVPVDTSEAWKDPQRRSEYFGTVDPNKFLISVGRDLRLVPGQQGAPVNIWIHPYVEVDGQPFDGATTQFRFQNMHTTQQEVSAT